MYTSIHKYTVFLLYKFAAAINKNENLRTRLCYITLYVHHNIDIIFVLTLIYYVGILSANINFIRI